MSAKYQNWEVSGYMRDATDWDQQGVRFALGYQEPVVVVFDPKGLRMEVTMDGDNLTSLTLHARNIDQAATRSMPLGYLREIAATYIRYVEQSVAEGIPLDAALAMAEQEPSDIRQHGDRPSLEDFAKKWHEEKTKRSPDNKRITRRQALADHYGVTVHAIDKWTRSARDANPSLIDPKKVGRPRGDSSPNYTEKGNENDNTKK